MDVKDIIELAAFSESTKPNIIPKRHLRRKTPGFSCGERAVGRGQLKKRQKVKKYQKLVPKSAIYVENSLGKV